MAFPKFGESVPSLTEWQMHYAGMTWGPSTAFEFMKLEGAADMPTVRSGDSGRPRDHGMFVGLDVMSGREITVTGQLKADKTSFSHAWQQLAAATVPGGTTETPLYINLPGYGTLGALARVRKRQMPVDIQFALGKLADVVLLLACSDPRWYAVTQQETIKPPTLTNGFKFPLAFNLSFGGGSVVGEATVENVGSIEMRPILIVEGPCTSPSITNASLTGEPNLTFAITLNAGDTLAIDTDLHTAFYTPSGSTTAVNRLSSIVSGSQWFSLLPGANKLLFLGGATGEGTLKVQWASAYI